ncbi:MAG: CapA family protein [Bacillota bacterium]|nr:CapA family protein [Bacillota bacterium]
MKLKICLILLICSLISAAGFLTYKAAFKKDANQTISLIQSGFSKVNKLYSPTPSKNSASTSRQTSTSTCNPTPKASNSPTFILSTATPEVLKEDLKIIAVGDILLGRGVGARLEKQKKGYLYPFEKVKPILKQGDVIFGNLEESITNSNKSLDERGKIVLKNSSKAFEGIKDAGFNLLNLANNHIMDYYDKGLIDTINLLNKNGIAHAGAGKNLDEARKMAIIEKNNLKIGLLSYTDMSDILYRGNPYIRFKAGSNNSGVAPRELKYIMDDIKNNKSGVDLLIVSLHWGKEESFDILPEQVQFAHTLLDAGADLILGHHPHQFQGIEIYNGKPIVYSMGNFIFDQNDPENQESFILNMGFNKNKLINFSLTPVKTINKIQVAPQKGDGANEMLLREDELCKKLGSNCYLEDDKVVFKLK